VILINDGHLGEHLKPPLRLFLRQCSGPDVAMMSHTANDASLTPSQLVINIANLPLHQSNHRLSAPFKRESLTSPRLQRCITLSEALRCRSWHETSSYVVAQVGCSCWSCSPSAPYFIPLLESLLNGKTSE